MKVLYFDCFAGISGDMTLAALMAIGADQELLRQKLSCLDLEGYRIEVGHVAKGHLAAVDVHVIVEGHDHHHRGLSDIINIIEGSDLTDWVKESAIRAFARLADAEAIAHGTTPDKVHFHEVGAVDAIVDIVGSMICLDLLGRPHVISSPMPTFHGFATGSHGTFPLPAPATVELLRGVPWRELGAEGELVTPTGAAIITTIASEFSAMPAMTVEKVGYGAGKRDHEFPNLLRVMLSEESSELPTQEQVSIIETNIDDLNPQFYESVMDRLFKAGALDVYLAPIQMKKNRPGTLLSILCSPEITDLLVGIVLAETSTLGVRVHRADRVCLERCWEEVETKYGHIRIKIGKIGDKVVNASPEYEDCRQAAEKNGVPVKQVYDLALARYMA